MTEKAKIAFVLALFQIVVDMIALVLMSASYYGYTSHGYSVWTTFIRFVLMVTAFMRMNHTIYDISKVLGHRSPSGVAFVYSLSIITICLAVYGMR